MESNKIKTFKDLNAWQESHKLVLLIYELCKNFPKDETFALSNQLKRASVSVTSNIAEGFKRRSIKEKVQFYSMAQASLTEIESQITTAQDLQYPGDYKIIFAQILSCHKLLMGLVKKTHSLPHSTFHIQHSNLGFTLIEVVIVVALVGVASVILSSLFIGQNRLYRSETAELTITGDARAALDDIDNYVRQANRTQASYLTYTAGSSVLILQIQSVNASNQLIAGTFDNVVYYLSANNLLRQVFPDAASARLAITKQLAANVTGLAFGYNNASFPLVTEVQTDLTVEENAGMQTRSITISSKAKLRNY